MESEQPTEESITKKEVVPNKERPTRRKQRRSGLKNFRRMFQRTGEPMPEVPEGDKPKAKISRQAKRRLNKRTRRAAAAAAAATTPAATITTAAAAPSPPTPNDKSRVMARSPQSKKDGDKPLDFKQPLAFRPKNSTAVAESPSETLSLTLRPKNDRA
ncbi:hypothetical protein PCG10_001304 [Penicillium crustosum]|uniref:Uncharacterized protein n=1 Tax=Penicillium crustosum TaxID=36656 RepID=A0A9P5GDG3_PENCR|nr:uncharacterized protein N7487_010481 [Penicillium crustosum]KAF7517289.1 hypothetical protein PCG10_001304 [Penicillium crustosum]KAJ5396178.1 hypothetical protein N7487_010481 [Penicillium crustosum]